MSDSAPPASPDDVARRIAPAFAESVSRDLPRLVDEVLADGSADRWSGAVDASTPEGFAAWIVHVARVVHEGRDKAGRGGRPPRREDWMRRARIDVVRPKGLRAMRGDEVIAAAVDASLADAPAP